MTLSDSALQQTRHLITAIKQHPFNQELMTGVLRRDKFAYYIEQDSIYLQSFARALALLAAKAPSADIQSFLKYSEQTFIAEQEMVHQFFNKEFNLTPTGKLSTATIGYTSYLLQVCLMAPFEVGFASVLPCFWVYLHVGLHIAQHASLDNPYIRWIETYSSDEFSSTVDEVMKRFDSYALNCSEQTKTEMLDAFYKSTCFEWHFWNDAYQLDVFDLF